MPRATVNTKIKVVLSKYRHHRLEMAEEAMAEGRMISIRTLLLKRTVLQARMKETHPRWTGKIRVLEICIETIDLMIQKATGQSVQEFLDLQVEPTPAS